MGTYGGTELSDDEDRMYTSNPIKILRVPPLPYSYQQLHHPRKIQSSRTSRKVLNESITIKSSLTPFYLLPLA